ncbi:MAG: uroporphyrinogen-III synthase [Chlorobi bacterium OLB5]|nr:MAG: uroporphyrinogen-III synthase [Chlorobi bacterium OLB5]
MSVLGKKILCTRPAEDAAEFSALLGKYGAEVITAPLIEIHPVKDFSQLDNCLDKITEYSGIIFTSSNAVRYFFERVKQKKINISIKLYAVGSKTKEFIERSGYKVFTFPENYNSASLAEVLKADTHVNSKFLFPAGNIGMKTILKELPEVEEIVVYETRKPMKNQLLQNAEIMLASGLIDCIAFFSPSAVTNFAELFPGYRNFRTEYAVIGKTTERRLQLLGLKADIISDNAEAERLGEAINKFYNEQ